MTAARSHTELLLAAVRHPLDAARLQALVRSAPDWPRVLRAAAWHGVRPLLHRALQAACPGDPPPAVVERLRAAVEGNARRNLQLTAELLGLLEALARRGVLVVPYKGPTLAVLAYGDLALREFADLDLLLAPADLPVATAVLRGRGYRPAFELSRAETAALLANQHEYLFYREADRTIVELQWRVVPRHFRFPLDLAACRGRLTSIELLGHAVPALAVEDLLLALCVHGTKHLWPRLVWVCDVAELIRASPALDWATLTARADALGVARITRLGLRLAADLLGAPLPEPVRQVVDADPTVAPLAAEAERWLTLDGAASPGLLAESRFHVAARERVADRVRYCVGLVSTTTPSDWTAFRLPGPLFVLYYPLRFLRLAVKYGRGTRRQARRSADGRS